jgi:hypothetical protein
MAKRIFLLLVLLLLCQESVWAQKAREDDRAARKQWEEEQRADEYATSLRRRDWLKDRLILELGMGTKFPAMGENWFGFGAGAEYITRWHFSGFVTAGFIPSHEDPIIPQFTLNGGMGWRVGMAYYMFPKSPIHLSVQASYGTVYYDHKAEPDDFNPAEPEKGGSRALLLCRGYEFDISISYLSDQWYFLQAIVGMYYIGNGLKDDPDGGGKSGIGLENPSWEKNIRTGALINLVTEKSGSKSEYAIPPYGVVFGVGVGFAFDEFFPDDTELRRRERESKSKQSDMRRPAAAGRAAPASSRRAPSAAETTEEEE